MKTNARRMLRLAAAVAIVGVGLAFATPAKAQWGVVVHPSSIYVHRTYQPTYSHLNYQRILYTHGLYQRTPHFTTGHSYHRPHHGHTPRHPHHR